MSSEEIETSALTVTELVNHLVAENRLGLPLSLIRVAIGNQFIDENTLIEDGMEIILIPPVAGG